MHLGKLELAPNESEDINCINAEVLHQLKANDTAFSMGQPEGGCVCIKFGLITDETDVEELVELVQNTGKEVEESSKVKNFMCVRAYVYLCVKFNNNDNDNNNNSALI